MARNKKVNADQFAIELDEIIKEVGEAAQIGLYEGIKSGLKTGAGIWRKHAKDAIGTHQYKRSGETHTTGMYARSITSHMLSNDETKPVGEIGSRKLAGLSHLLEFGHARVGDGGRENPVKPVLHIMSEVVPPTYEATISAVEAEIDRAIK